MICKVCNQNVDSLNDMNVCEFCDDLIQKRILIKNSHLTDSGKEKLFNEINNCSIKDIKDIIHAYDLKYEKNDLENLISKIKQEDNDNELNSKKENVFYKFHPNKKYQKYLWIDYDNELWCPNPRVDWIDGTLIESKNQIYYFKDIISYEIQENGQTIQSYTKGGLGSAIVGGAIFGGVGAVVGSNIGKRNTVSKSNMNYIVFIFLKNTDEPTISIHCGESIEIANNIVGFLNQIITKTNEEKKQIENMRKENIVQNNESSIAEEILKYKNLLDNGIITQDEFEKLKEKIINA